MVAASERKNRLGTYDYYRRGDLCRLFSLDNSPFIYKIAHAAKARFCRIATI